MASFIRFPRRLGVVSPLLLALCASFLGCDDETESIPSTENPDGGTQADAGTSIDPGSSTGSTETKPVSPKPVGTEDPTTDDPPDVQVDANPDEITISMDDLPAGEGDLVASIVKVDGSEVFSTQTFAESSDERVQATLKLPPDLTAQSQLVEWNVRIERSSDNQAPIVVKSLLHFLAPAEVHLEGPAKVTEGKRVAYRLLAQHPITRERLPQRAVALEVTQNGDVVASKDAETDQNGAVAIELELARAGAYSVRATTASAVVQAAVEEEIQVQSFGGKLLLTSDKPLYKPGQTIHLRALALGNGGNAPIAAETATFEVEDGKGNKVFKKTLDTDDFGIASTPFVIGNVVNEGSYKLRVLVGDVVSEKTVEVSQYALPKFNLATRTDKTWYSPGDAIQGVVDAKYFFGKSVAGAGVQIEAATIDVGRNVYQQVVGSTNASGSFEFSLGTPSTLVGLPLEQGMAVINLTVTVTDTAGQVVTKDVLVRVASQPLNVSLVPEGTALVPGIENRLNLFISDPLGAPIVGATAVLELGDGTTTEVDTDAYGYALVVWTPTQDANTIVANIEAGDVELTGLTFDFGEQEGTEHVLVRTDKSLYDVGETLTVDVFTSDESGSVFIDWLNDGQAVDLRSLEPSDGKATFSATLDETLLGDNRIEAYIVQDDGHIVRAGRTIVVRQAKALVIDIEPDQEVYAPGAPASISFKVTDEEGQPAVAALGVQIVDEAVFSLVDAKPGLLQTYFELEDEFAQPSYELHPPVGSLATTILNRPTDEDERAVAQSKAEATLAALGHAPIMGLNANSWPDVVADSKTLLQPYYDAATESLVLSVNTVVPEAIDAVIAKGCDLTYYWCDSQSLDLAAVIKTEIASRLEGYDFWGSAYTFTAGGYGLAVVATSSGPDETPATPDDATLSVDWDAIDWGSAPAIQQVIDPALGGAGGQVPQGAFPEPAPDFDEGVGADDGAGNEGPEPPAEEASGDGEGPRVRRDFPETLYVNPALITNSSGEATIELDVADSITQWRISSLGNSASGQLGSAVGSMTVFQDFFIDVNFPATLTRGDEIDFPIAVYNYLDEAQTVNIELDAADWYTALGESSLSVELEPGEVKGVSFPVRVDDVGLNTLTVRGLGSDKSDAVARSVRVVPNGKQLATAQSGALEGAVAHTVRFDATSVPGSEQLYLNIFPTYLSQAVQGLDSMLQVPNGCFEQTTATAWPNVLVTDYMQRTDQITPEILLKAESLMSAGYQRLLTFEHPGGGFSWFGTQDPKPFLSVTAFGLMEFHDMAKVHTVDEAMLERTLAYLLSQQQADGSWLGDQSEFFSFHTSGLRNTAFTLMALGSAKYTGTETAAGAEYVKQELASTQELDAYTLALAANALASVAPTDSVLDDLLSILADMAVPDPDDDTLLSWDTNGTQTNFYGYGSDAEVTTTALVVHAMLLAGGYNDHVERGLNKLAASKDSLGNFGSTQATVWTLKTLLLAATKGTDPAVGELVVAVDGDTIQTLTLTPDQSDVMTTVDMSHLATTGDHDVSLTFTGTGKVSYNLLSAFHVPWEEVAEEGEGPLSVAVQYDRTSLAVDETVAATVTVTNNTEQVQNMALVTLGLPPGFEVEREDFVPYLDAGSLSKADVTGRQVILYVSELAANANLAITYDLRATMPVTASDGGGSVHLYYQPEQKSTTPEQTLEAVAVN